MNDSQLDARIQSAFPAPTVPSSLDGRIDAALDRHRRARRIARPVRLAVAGVATVALLTVMGPPVYAQAMIGRIAGALDGVKSVRITRLSIDAQGNRIPAGEVVYHDGLWRMRSAGEDTVFRNGKNYQFDPILKAYVVSERPDGPFAHNSGIRMSEMLGTANQWSFDRRIKIESATLEGRRMRRATVENPGLGERYLIYADPATDLPQEVQVESREGGNWRLRMVQSLEYGSAISPKAFELDKAKPVITQAHRTERVIQAMTKDELATLPLRHGRLVVRAVDVAADGSVFVAYQSGDRSVNTWRGYAFDLSDDLGTTYARREFFGGSEDFAAKAKDGKLEVEVFVPLQPIDPRQPRRLSLLTRRMKNRTLTRMTKMLLQQPSGEMKLLWTPNLMGRDPSAPTETTVLRKPFRGATCDYAPAYASLVSYSDFSNEVKTAIFTSDARAKWFYEQREWDASARWYEEELLQMRRHERMGLGPWSEETVLSQLEKIKTRTWTP